MGNNQAIRNHFKNYKGDLLTYCDLLQFTKDNSTWSIKHSCNSVGVIIPTTPNIEKQIFESTIQTLGGQLSIPLDSNMRVKKQNSFQCYFDLLCGITPTEDLIPIKKTSELINPLHELSEQTLSFILGNSDSAEDSTLTRFIQSINEIELSETPNKIYAPDGIELASSVFNKTKPNRIFNIALSVQGMVYRQLFEQLRINGIDQIFYPIKDGSIIIDHSIISYDVFCDMYNRVISELASLNLSTYYLSELKE